MSSTEYTLTTAITHKFLQVRNVIYYLIVIVFVSCKSANNYYQGKVQDQNGNPLEGVSVFEEGSKDIRGTYSDSSGYFKLKRSPDWLGNLVFIKEGYLSDTVPSVRSLAGERVRYYFIEDDTTVVRLKIASEDFHIWLPLRNFPIEDSTNFENFERFGMRNSEFLRTINFDARRKDATNFRFNYRIPFSEIFASIVITYQCGENELFTTLVTLNKENKIIDRLTIAYDEVAESAFRKTSRIDKRKIVVTSSNWMSGEPIMETETFIVEKSGKFRKVQGDEIRE